MSEAYAWHDSCVCVFSCVCVKRRRWRTSQHSRNISSNALLLSLRVLSTENTGNQCIDFDPCVGTWLTRISTFLFFAFAVSRRSWHFIKCSAPVSTGVVYWKLVYRISTLCCICSITCIMTFPQIHKIRFSLRRNTFFPRKSPLRIGSPNASPEVVHRPRSPLLYILILGTCSKFARKNDFLALSVDV